jgi:thiol-disulfide isomerase/thioredoxin
MKYEIRSRGLLWSFFGGFIYSEGFNLWPKAQGFLSLIGGTWPSHFLLNEKVTKESRLSNLWLKLQSRGAQTEPLRFASLLHFASSPLLCNFFTPNLLRPELQNGSAEFGFSAQGFPALMSGQTLVLFSLMKKERKKSRLSNLWRERLRIGAQSEAIPLRSTSTLCFFTNPLSFFNAKSSEADLLNGSAIFVKNNFFMPNLLRLDLRYGSAFLRKSYFKVSSFLRSELLNGSANAPKEKVLLGCDVSYRQHDEGFYGAKQAHSIIQFLKRLWSTYRENQRLRKEVQRRLLRKRAFGKRKASLDIKTHSLKLKAALKFKVESIKFKAELLSGRSLLYCKEALNLQTSLVLLMMFSGVSVNAQELKPLKVGQQVPNVVVGNLLGFGQNEVQFSDLKGKVVLIDFWSIYCGSCIGNMPHLQSLRDAFKDSLVVLPVNAESKEKIEKLWSNNPNLKKLPIYTTYGDQVLGKLFPHALFPHLVWIDRTGKYLGASSVEYANVEVVRNIYDGGDVSWNEKTDVDLFDPKMVSLHAYLKKDTADYILPYLKGMSNQSRLLLQADSTLRYYVVNTQLVNEYAVATMASNGLPYEPKRRDVVLPDAKAYEYQSNYGYSADWKKKYAFSYERVFAKGTSEAQIHKLLLDDLNQHFGLDGKIVTEEVAVLGLRKSGATIENIKDSIKKTKLRYWLEGMNKIPGLLWVVNDTGLSDQTLMPVLPANISVETLPKYLEKIGFVLAPSVKAIQMFHLKPKN